MSSEIVTTDIATSVLDGINEINGTRRNYDSTSDERRCLDLTPAQIALSLKSFSYNLGIVSDGTSIRLDEHEIYFKFPVNISMIDSASQERSFVYTASDRAAVGHPSLHVFVDGLKIPDNEIKFYPTKSNVDVFVPLKYINQESGSSIIVEKILYDLVPYLRFYAEKTSEQYVTISATPDQIERASIKERNVQIYVNKRLYTGSRSVAVTGNNSILVSIYQEVQNAEVEVIIDNAIQYFFPGQNQPLLDHVVFEIPESYIDSIHGPVSKFSCYFFVDGRRIPNTKVKQIGRLHFRYELGEIKQVHTSMCITDRAFIEDKDATLYACDYYLYNMIGCRAITEQQQNGSSGTIFDGNIDFDEVLNKRGTQYDRQLLNQLLKEYGELATPSTKVSHLLQGRPSSMRTFLENFGNEVYSYVVEFDGKGAFVYFGLPSTYELSDTRNYIISINDRHVPSDDIEIINKSLTDVFKVDAKYFEIGENDIDIIVIDERQVEYESFRPSDIELRDGYSTLKVTSFERVRNVDDIHILEKVVDDDSYNYVNDKRVGYKNIPDAMIEIDEDGVVNIVFETIPLNDFIVYNSNFSCKYSYTKPLSSDVMDVSIPLYTGGENNPVPFIPRGKIEVFAGNEKLINGLDYFIKHPVNEETAAGSFLILTRAVLPGTQIDIYFSNLKTKQIVSYEGYIKNNKYGLFYLGDLKYPVSLKYLDIYLNGKKVGDNDIDILSDKLIRIHSFNNPFYDLSVESTFNVEEDELAPYLALYEEDDFEKYIASLFRGVYYGRDARIDEEVPNFNAIYETFVDTVDSVNKRPNPTAREEEWIPNDNDNPDVIGISNDGSAMGGEDINCSIIVGGYVVFAGNKGRVATYQLATKTWGNYDDENAFSNDGAFVNGEDITAIVFCKNYILFGTASGHIGAYDLNKKTWCTIGSQLNMKIELNKLTPDIYPTNAIRKMIYLKEGSDLEQLYVMGDGGNCATYDFTDDVWYGYNTNTERQNCATVSHIMDAIYDAYFVTVNGNTILVVAGSNGEIASCRIKDNAWVMPNGQRYYMKKAAPSIYNDGSYRDNKDIYSCARYLVYYVYTGEDGVVTAYNTLTGEYISDPTQIRNITNAGSHSKFNNDNALVCYEDAILVAGSDLGKISNYAGSVQAWRSCDYGLGITDDGEMMDGNGIKSIVYTASDTNYIIFSGEGGKVCSYNVDVHEVPFRYDPYKTAFLKWYTTPGSAVISTVFDIGPDLCRKFSMYHNSDLSDYDIRIGSGDIDLIADIYMNDRGAYPNTIPRRLRFLAEMIQGMGDGRYTCDEIYQYYKENKYHNILYERDLVPLQSHVLDVDYDIHLT